jgi:hypothetical protein
MNGFFRFLIVLIFIAKEGFRQMIYGEFEN